MSKDRYPHPRKNEKVTCLGCNQGWVKTPTGLKKCKACKGKGYIKAN